MRTAAEIRAHIEWLEGKRSELTDLSRQTSGVQRWFEQPVAWVRDVVQFEGEGPADYQLAVLSALPEKKRVSVRGPHGLGKTTIMAWAILWFATTRDGLDWKIPTTASWWRQLQKFLWPEIHKWSRKLDWSKLGREPFNRWELQQLNLKLRTGEAFAAASSDPAALEGAHADHLLYIFDESKAIDPETFDAAEGAFAGTGEAMALAFSTPGPPQGRFYDIHRRSRGLEDWHTIHITLDQAIAAGRIDRAWSEQRARQWGPTSPVYLNRVKGEFANSDEDSTIPLEWIEAANRRWEEWNDAEEPQLGTIEAIGVDVARSGSARTVLALRAGPVIVQLRDYQRLATTATTGKVRQVVRRFPHAVPVVDVIGIGAGVVDQLREANLAVIAFNASEWTDVTDASGELGFLNKRSAAWWHLRDLLDPSNDSDVCLPPNDMLLGDLCAPKWAENSRGVIKVESKQDLAKRLGRSTDFGDAVIQAFWYDFEQPVMPLKGRTSKEHELLTVGF